MSSVVKKLSWRMVFWAFQVPMFILIVLGILPRSIVPYFAGLLALYVILAPLEEAVLFFIASIPLFIAIPITANWDNFNTWRILSLIIFLRWLISKDNFSWLFYGMRDFIKKPVQFSRAHPVLVTLFLLLVICFLSLVFATDIRAGITRIIYFVNLSLVGIVIWDLIRNFKLEIRHLIQGIFTATVLVVTVGYIQLASTYLMDVYQFMRLWGEGIQLRQFGTVWSTIAVRMGNTWLAYYGPQLSLRVFSLFPDSHSFPVFVLLGMPALFAFGIRRIAIMSEVVASVKKMIRTYANMSVLWIPAAFLIIILSGTRGIWVASIPVTILAIMLSNKKMFALLHKPRVCVVYEAAPKTDESLNLAEINSPALLHRNLFRYCTLYLLVFFLLFSVAYPIFVSPQFLLAKGDWALLADRIKSIVNFGETSNALRIQIWKQTLVSISEHPLLGVGIGNFPTALGQRVFLAKAGSSAHNIYLHIAAELGIPALLLSLWFFWLVFTKVYKNFLSETVPELMSYWATLLLFYPWVLAYLITDAALFDERAFLLFTVTVALIFARNPANTNYLLT